MTSEMVTARGFGRSSSPKYQVTAPDGTVTTEDLYIDARRLQREIGGTITEVRETV
jgi:hypothetical protein